MNRRSFLGAMLAAAAAPAIVKADNLMKIVVPSKELFVPSQEIAAPAYSLVIGPANCICVGDFIRITIGNLTQQFVVTSTACHPSGKTTLETVPYAADKFASDCFPPLRREGFGYTLYRGSPARIGDGAGPSIELSTRSSQMASQFGK